MSIQVILFDLDGTLLEYNMARDFLPPYLEAMATSVAHLVPPQKLVDGILAGSGAITTNDGTHTNEEVFASVFYSFVDMPREILEPALAQFYDHDFHKLQQYTRTKPSARDVMHTIIDLGYDVIIATNPYFPIIAIQQRLSWAGVEDFPYRKITSYENSHFAKPDLRYFTEILDEFGYAPEEALVVGDEAMDMVAAQAGCPTFLVPSPATDMADIKPTPTYRGTLEDVVELLKSARTPSAPGAISE